MPRDLPNTNKCKIDSCIKYNICDKKQVKGILKKKKVKCINYVSLFDK